MERDVKVNQNRFRFTLKKCGFYISLSQLPKHLDAYYKREVIIWELIKECD